MISSRKIGVLGTPITQTRVRKSAITVGSIALPRTGKLAQNRQSRLGRPFRFVAAAVCLFCGQGAFAEQEHMIPLMMSASNFDQQGFARIINHSDTAGTVSILAIDDAGIEYGPVELSLDAKATAHFNSDDLERGNSGKGLSDGVGSGEGDWRLVLRTNLLIEPMAYVRTMDGFVTNAHILARTTAVYGVREGYHVPFFNPGGNVNQQSRLRLINVSDSNAEVVIDGMDDLGSGPRTKVRLTLSPGAARNITAQELESGSTGLSGSFGAGTGKWQLFLSAGPEVLVLSLLESPTGHLAIWPTLREVGRLRFWN